VRKRHTSTGFPSVVKRKNGKKVVIWRWYEAGQDGKSRERWKTLGLASRFKSDAAAQKEAERLGLGRPIEAGPRTLKELVDHWLVSRPGDFVNVDSFPRVRVSPTERSG
jgi:hypothetical protein